MNIKILKVSINGELWTEVPSFKSSRPDDTHYMVHTDSDGTSLITFGNGENGKRPPTGAVRSITTQSPDGHIVDVSLKRSEGQANMDIPLWTVISDTSGAISFHQYDKFINENRNCIKSRECFHPCIIGLILMLIGGLIAWFFLK